MNHFQYAFVSYFTIAKATYLKKTNTVTKEELHSKNRRKRSFLLYKTKWIELQLFVNYTKRKKINIASNSQNKYL